MARKEFIFSGFGGQGIVLSGIIIGKAASIYDDLNASLTQSYGPEARGGACCANVVLSDIADDYPRVTHPDILVVMSQEAFTTYFPRLEGEGMLLYDETLVEPTDVAPGVTAHSIPATKLAEQIGKRIVANIVMIGFFTAVTGQVKYDAMKEAVLNSVPKGTEELNTKAFETGYQYAQDQL